MKNRGPVVVWAMIGLRVLLCPTIILGARSGWAGAWLAGIVIVALVDDIFDGVLARRWGCDSASLRLADSIADTIFYLGVAAALWIRNPELLSGNKWLFAILFGLEGVRYIFDFWKFGKAASYHSYMAKAWGVILAAAMIGVFALGRARVLVSIALMWGITVNIEGFIMSLLLSQWKNDVKTLSAAWVLRKLQSEQ
jgi:phosphatidylglycerophosphate synthase